jgi:cation diffusion facilitator CzcD-associated flavoprotein CzcO
MTKLPTVCVIGAGSSGIAAAKALHERGVPFDCFEKGDRVGGNWVFQNKNGMSSSYRGLHINTSRDRMEYSDYDAVLVANGHHWDPRWPEPAHPGQFDGEQMHAHHCVEPDGFKDKRVVVVGIGNSAMDIAVEASYLAKKVFLSSPVPARARADLVVAA